MKNSKIEWDNNRFQNYVSSIGLFLQMDERGLTLGIHWTIKHKLISLW